MRRRQVLLVVVVALVAAVAGAGGALLLTDTSPARFRPSRDVDPQAARQWEQARALWQTRGPSDYRYVWTTTAMIGVGRTQVDVRRAGEQVTNTPQDQIARGAVVRGSTGPTVEGVFAEVRSAQATAAEVRVTYHPVLGYPTHVEVDDIAGGVDDEYRLEVGELHPLAP